jgi:hypothetical protein
LRSNGSAQPVSGHLTFGLDRAACQAFVAVS